jgi:serine/threonine protein kinase
VSFFGDVCSFSSQLRHKNVVRFVDFCEDKEFYYIVMELVTGGELLAKLGGKVKAFVLFSSELFAASGLFIPSLCGRTGTQRARHTKL